MFVGSFQEIPGTVLVPTGVMRVSDPCYDPSTWCSGTLDVVPGEWEAGVLLLSDEDSDGWGPRVAALAIKHRDALDIAFSAEMLNETTDNPEWEDSGIDVGVDSGQCGFYDDEYFRERGGRRSEEWYKDVCQLTTQEPLFAGITWFDKGVASSSGWGDGGYTCMVHRKTPGGPVDAAYIAFIY